jgi:hypothetical protein
MNSRSSKTALLAVSVLLIVAASAFIFTAGCADSDDILEDRKQVGDVMNFAAGSGTVTHTPGQDVCKYGTDTKVTLSLTVITTPTDYNNGWDDVGTLTVTDIEFSANSDIIYVPSYIVDKVGSDIGLYKVTAIDDSVIAEINEKTICIILPNALQSVKFSKNVTIVKEGSYTDTKGNVIHYSIDETSTAYMNGYGGYGLYANSKDADLRFCEQATVTKVDYAAGQTTYDTRMSQWASNDLTCSDTLVCGLSWGDMIGTVLTYGLEFGGKGVSYNIDSLRCATNATVSIADNVLTVNAYTVTATPKDASAQLVGWNLNDGDIITSDMEIVADYGYSEDNGNVYVYSTIIVILILLVVAAYFHVKCRR